MQVERPPPWGFAEASGTKRAPHPTRVSGREEARRFKVSVVLPLGPLDSDMLANLNEKQACALYGMMTTSRCSQCHLISYCVSGQYSSCKSCNASLPTSHLSACQTADWLSHEVTCRPLKGGRWCMIPFRTALPGLEHAHLKVVTSNSSDSVHCWP